MNTDIREMIGIIHDTNGVHGIATIPALDKDYIINEKANILSVYDINTIKAKSPIRKRIA